MVTFILLVVGGLNWGLYAFGWDVVKFLPDVVAKVVYLLVGVSALVEVFTHKGMCAHCATKEMPMSTTM